MYTRVYVCSVQCVCAHVRVRCASCVVCRALHVARRALRAARCACVRVAHSRLCMCVCCLRVCVRACCAARMNRADRARRPVNTLFNRILCSHSRRIRFLLSMMRAVYMHASCRSTSTSCRSGCLSVSRSSLPSSLCISRWCVLAPTHVEANDTLACPPMYELIVGSPAHRWYVHLHQYKPMLYSPVPV